MYSSSSNGFLLSFQGAELPRGKVNFEILKNEISLLTGADPATIGIAYSEGGIQTIQTSGRRIDADGVSRPERRETKVEIPASLTVSSADPLEREAVAVALKHHNPAFTDAELFQVQRDLDAKDRFLENLKSVWPEFVQWLSMGARPETERGESGRDGITSGIADRGKT